MKKPKPRPGTPDGARPLDGYPRRSWYGQRRDSRPTLHLDVTCPHGSYSDIPEVVIDWKAPA